MAGNSAGGTSRADQLCELQVAHVMAELTGERLAANIDRDVDAVLGLLRGIAVRDLVDRDAVTAVLSRLVGEVPDSVVVADLAAALSDGIYDMGAGDEILLGEVLDRDSVIALVHHALTLQRLSDRVLDRLTESPLVAVIASKFVAKIVGDFMQQNRAMAEKVPGMSTMLNIGAGATKRVRGVTDKHLDQLLGDAAGKGASFALKRTNNAIRELLHDAPLEAAALELWDLHAQEPIGDLRAYLSRDELRELVARVVDLVAAAGGTDFAGHLVATCVDVFFAKYGEHDVPRLLTELDIDPAAIADDLRVLLPRLLETANRAGAVEALVRARVTEFYARDDVRALLA
jgi:hypothetical protein